MIKKINFIKKIKYFFLKPKFVLLFGDNFNLTEKIILNIENNLKIINANNLDISILIFLLKNSTSPILVFKNEKEIAHYKIKAIVNNLPSSGSIAFNKNNSAKETFKTKLSPTQVYSFSLNRKADLTLTKLHKNHGTNFKINYKGNSVPFWVKDRLSQNKGIDLLAAITVGVILKNNLVKISQILKEKN